MGRAAAARHNGPATLQLRGPHAETRPWAPHWRGACFTPAPIVIDLHSHILPGIDDGPRELEGSLALARAYVADGVQHVVATPHVFPGRHDNQRSNIAQEHARFTQALVTYGIPLSLSFAGEVRLTPEVLDLLARGELPYLGGEAAAKVMLLELPDAQVPLGADKFTAHLLRQGITPLIAHPERNRGVMERPERMQPFIDAGCKLQLTAGSLIGEFGSRAQQTAVALLEAGWVHAVASDAHNLAGRAPRMTPARAWLVEHYGEATARQLTHTGPARLCNLPQSLAAA